MYKILPLFLLFISSIAFGQVVSVSPTSPTINDEITLTFDIKQSADTRADGLKGLTTGVYLWGGAGDDSNAFIYGPDNQIDFGQPVVGGEMTSLGNDVWQITLVPRIYFNIPAGVEITRLGLLLKNTNGSAQTEDLFINIATGAFIKYTSPANYNATNFVSANQFVTLTAEPSSAGDLEMFIDEGSGFTSVATAASATSISYDYQVTRNVTLDIKIVADLGTEIVERTQSLDFFIKKATITQALPPGIVPGINYDPADGTRVTLALTAPMKGSVYVVGDFTGWQLNDNYQMKRDPDGETFWLNITGLTSGREYIFQYWVEGTIKVGDPYADKVADPYNDRFIPESVYPGLIPYTNTKDGIATVLQTAQPAFNWIPAESTWQRPRKEELIIYELLVRDFLGSHSYDDLADTLNYLKKLGVNAIELMPIMEFDGNESWGYNPAYYLAPDKYYGTKNDLKNFIQMAHQKGIAVLLDMVLNHATGSNSYAAMYWDAQNNRPSADNPWFNVTPKHEFNVFNDFNHESRYTQALVDTVNAYWLEEYHFDGFRFDLSKGFTQKNTIGDIGAFGQYDQSRIDILTRMASKIQSVDPTAYIILEHFAEDAEENVLADRGMLLWRNFNYTFSQALTGINPEINTGGVNNRARISYIESHDEERLMYENLEQGRKIGGYDASDLSIALDRMKLGVAFFYTMPGPKMIWQFQELGYDLSINTCSDGVTIDNSCRLANKPLPWGNGNLGYYESEMRQQLFNTHRAVIGLTKDFPEVFDMGVLSSSLGGKTKRINIRHATMDVTIIGNFDLLGQSFDPDFSTTGKWYDYLSGDSIQVDNSNQSISLLPGEFHIYTTKKLNQPEGDTYITPAAPVISSIASQTINANETLEMEVNIVAGTSALDKVVVTATSSNQELVMNTNITVSGSGATRLLTVTPSNQAGSTVISLRVSDGVVSSTTTFGLEVVKIVTGLDGDHDALLTMFPNPASTMVRFNLKADNAIELKLVDGLGRVTYPEIRRSGQNTIEFDSSNIPNGLYVVAISAGETKIHRRLWIKH